MKKIAVPVNSSNQLEDHFGQCEYYQIYTISDQNEILEIDTLESEQGCGCKSNIASVLAEHGVSLMLAGGIGNGAINVLNKCNIEVVRGCSGYTENIVKQYLEGKVIDSGESCAHHEHDHSHQCNH